MEPWERTLLYLSPFWFLLGWATKHFLDRMVLPPFLDWWARRTKATALKKAERLLEEFKRRVQSVSDVRALILSTQSNQAFYSWNLMGLVLAIPFLVTISLVGRDAAGWVGYLIILMSSLAILVQSLVYWTADREMNQYKKLVAEPEKARLELVRRVDKLLVAAGMSVGERDNWLEARIPKLPAAT